MFEKREDGFKYKEKCNDFILRIRELIPGDDVHTKIKYYMDHPYLMKFNPPNKIVEDTINHIINDDPSLVNLEKKFKTLNKIEIDLLIEVLNIPTEELKLRKINTEIMKSGANHQNIRFHYFDLRKISFADLPKKIILTSDSIFPFSINERRNLYTHIEDNYTQYEKKLDEIAMEHSSTDILTIIDYLSNNTDDDDAYTRGEQIFKEFHEQYHNLISHDITYSNYKKVINIISILIKKQINKSIFQPFNQFIEIFKKTVADNHYWWGDFLGGVILTELYSIPRMFKKFEPKNIKTREDSCDENKENMENIIYIAGGAHTRFVYAFLKNWFNLSSEEDIIINVHINASVNQCIEIPQHFLAFSIPLT